MHDTYHCPPLMTDIKQPRRWQSVSSSGNSIDSSQPEIPKPLKKKKKRKKAMASSPVALLCSSRSSFSTASEEPGVRTPTHPPVTYEEDIPELPNQLQAAINEPLCV